MKNNTTLGIWLMIATTAIFSIQDGVTRYLIEDYSVFMIVMVRYWAFAAFAVMLAMRAPGGLRVALGTRHRGLHILRGALLALEICLLTVSFIGLGLIESHAVFASYPLLVTLMAAPILGEKIGWRRMAAVVVGLVGVLIILEPGTQVFSVQAILPFGSALAFGLYGVLTRYVSRDDSSTTSFFWTGIVGLVIMTAIGMFYWKPMQATDWGVMLALCAIAIFGHWLLIKTYETAEAAAVQPFAYLQLVFVSIIGVSFYGEVLYQNVVIGSAVVIGAGLFTLWRNRQSSAS